MLRDPEAIRFYFLAHPEIDFADVSIERLSPGEISRIAIEFAAARSAMRSKAFLEPARPASARRRGLYRGIFVARGVGAFLDTIPTGASNMRDHDHTGATWGRPVSREAAQRIAAQRERAERRHARHWLVGIGLLAAAAYIVAGILP